MLLEGVWCRKGGRLGLAIEEPVPRLEGGDCLAGPLGKLRLRIKGIHLARSAIHEQKDDRVRLGRVMRHLEVVPRQQVGQRERPEACPGALQKSAA